MNSNNMISNKFKLAIFLVLLAGLALINPAFAQQATSDSATATPGEATPGEATPGETTTGAAAEAAGAEAPAPDLDPGMQIPVDGSSLDAFNESLATIKAQAKEPNYISLEEAIKYLLVYDLGAQGDKAKLAKNLDGKTGDQIIDLVIWRK